MTEAANPGDGATTWWSRALLVGAVIALVLLAMAPLGYRTGVLPLQTAFLLLGGTTVLALVGVVGGLVAMVVVSRRGLASDRGPVLMALIVSAVLGGYMASQFVAARSVPPIHDISTDIDDPPEFVAIPALRGADANPLQRSAEVDTQQREAYADLAPVELSVGRADAVARARAAMLANGVELVHVDEEAGVVEGTQQTRFFGFKDDVVIRVRGADSGPSTVDVRSVSRVGQSDLGVNAARIRALLATMQAGS